MKNGFTQAAGYTLVSAAERGDTELIGVILKGTTDAGVYKDMTKPLDYGFAHFTSTLYMDADEKQSFVTRDTGKEVEFISATPLWVTIKDGEIPDLVVDSNGKTFVQSSQVYSPSESVATLMPIVPLAEQAEVQIASVTKNGATHAGGQRTVSSGWHLGVTITWSIMLVFIFAVWPNHVCKAEKKTIL